MLAERAAGLAWRLRRAERLQAEALDTLVAQQAWEKRTRDLADSSTPKWVKAVMGSPDDGQTLLGRALVHDCANSHVLERMGLYEGRIERSFFRTMNELRKHRLMREAEAADAGKSEIRSTKCETNANDRNTNDKNEIARARGSVKAKGLGDGGCESERHHRQAALDAATRGTTPDTVAAKIQTKPIEAPGVAKTAGMNG